MDTRINEHSIREKVYDRQVDLVLEADWYTPSGRERVTPIYTADIHNSYLEQSKTVKGKTAEEVEKKARIQLNKWAEQEIKRRIASAKQDLRKEALDRTEMAEAEIREYRSILQAALKINCRLDWKSLSEPQPFPAFTFDDPPTRAAKTPLPRKPRRTLPQTLIPWLWGAPRKNHLKALESHRQCEAKSDQIHAEAMAAWAVNRDNAALAYDEAKEKHVAQQVANAAKIQDLRANFESGNPSAICEYMDRVYRSSRYPRGCALSFRVDMGQENTTLIVNVALPDQSQMPQAQSFKYVAAHAHIEPVPIKTPQLDALYDEFLKQVILRTMHEAFSACYTSHVQEVVINGWVTSLDKGTGQETTACILSVMTTREVFVGLNLSLVDPTECIRKLKGLIAGPLSMLAPVKPILNLSREDSRFVESCGVLAELDATTNLAEMPWEDFEHLVRELFAGLFSGEGSEVRVTQASHDAGVDAIAFDPDPIRGGKFVIQAKRYSRVVGVSAVRELYGTIINEGASKGILVTTSHYGLDSWNFVKDKPISLIDGSNLVFLLEEQGHKVRIDIEAARRALNVS